MTTSNARCFPLLLLLLLHVDPARAQGGEDKFGQMEVATLAIFMAFGIGTVLFVLEKIVGRCAQSAAGFPVRDQIVSTPPLLSPWTLVCFSPRRFWSDRLSNGLFFSDFLSSAVYFFRLDAATYRYIVRRTHTMYIV